MLELRADLSVRMFCVDSSDLRDPEVTTLPPAIASQSPTPLTEKYAGYNDPIFYIYTSGTTGNSSVLLIVSSSQIFVLRASQGGDHQALTLPVRQLLSLLHGSHL